MDEIQKHYVKCLQWVYFVLCKLCLNKTKKKSMIWKKKEKKIYGESWSYPQRNTYFKFFYY